MPSLSPMGLIKIIQKESLQRHPVDEVELSEHLVKVRGVEADLETPRI